jgi:hypothetical protein
MHFGEELELKHKLENRLKGENRKKPQTLPFPFFSFWRSPGTRPALPPLLGLHSLPAAQLGTLPPFPPWAGRLASAPQPHPPAPATASPASNARGQLLRRRRCLVGPTCKIPTPCPCSSPLPPTRARLPPPPPVYIVRVDRVVYSM